MSWPFEIGKSYNRRQDIHGPYGGQRQSGIITPAAYPVVFLITGDSGQAHGYSDNLRPDGVFEYFGMGQVGDMEMTSGNKAIAEHSANGKSLLLFHANKDGSLQYRGECVCESYRTVQAPDREGNQRNAFIFELRFLDAVVEHVEIEPPAAPGDDLAELRRRAMQAARTVAAVGQGLRSIYQRSADVRNYVLARARGVCEGCEAPAPFVRPDGSPYLEPHHIRRVSDGGPDDPHHVIALCPNCHRRVHAGADGRVYNESCGDRMRRIEPA
ncbi:HNH endonuclease [Labrys sp. La1]|uniref:HNH endonuclease n=1 Tax=Labrys sp. La1 TaxID=3404917 RepID=UPI003EB83E8D